ncbi:trypsin-like serine peptidase [Ostreiculturibacter nitratireducens]|uniref:trypsin-like serine peptidase n=1 Tax=Ostreiculturibacter nitratireducens TaxID=3075226 RepID=UPI0031B5FC56
MRALAVLIALLSASGVMAQDTSLRALTTANDSKGWEAVGRLDIAGRAFCTGAMIAPDLVLTAAHCLYDRASGALIDAGEIEFLAGWRNGRAAAYRGVRRAIAHPDYEFEGNDKVDRVAYDLALLELDHPIRLPSIHPFETDTRPRKGEDVGVVSYAFDRAEAPSLQEACRVLARQSGVLVLSCSVDFGSSGAPVFTIRDGVPRIVSVVSAKAEMHSEPVSLGAVIADPLDDLRALLAVPMVPLDAAPRVRRYGEGAPAGGAKFLRP